MKNPINDKKVNIGGKDIITDWRQIKIASPKNLQEKIEANEAAKKEIMKQQEIVPSSSIVTEVF